MKEKSVSLATPFVNEATLSLGIPGLSVLMFHKLSQPNVGYLHDRSKIVTWRDTVTNLNHDCCV